MCSSDLGIASGFSNANVVAYGEAGWAGNIIPSANATYDLGNATNQWKSLYLSNSTLYLGNVAISMGAANVLQVAGANVVTAGAGDSISATGNITGNYILGDGSQLTNLPAGNYSNANVVSLLANFGSNVVSTTGNITSGYFVGNGSQLTGITASAANIFNTVSANGTSLVEIGRAHV